MSFSVWDLGFFRDVGTGLVCVERERRRVLEAPKGSGEEEEERREKRKKEKRKEK